MNQAISESLIVSQANATSMTIKSIKPNILVIDDNIDLLEVIIYALELFGYSYLTASNSKQGLSMAERMHPDTIILDIGLPEINGLYAMELLRRNSLTTDIPVIAMSILVELKHRDFFLAKGFTDCLPKPFSLSDLKKMLDEINQK